MRMWARMLVIQSIAIARAFPAAGCALPGWAEGKLLHYQAWSVVWRAIESEIPRTQDIKIAQEGSSWLVYSDSTRTAYRVTSDRVSSMTCWHYDSWEKCLADLRGSMPGGPSDLLLGSESRTAQSQEPCQMRLTTRAAPNWRPSPKGKIKDAMVSQFGALLARNIGSTARRYKAVCNDFNIKDPRVWVLLDPYVPANDEGLLVGIELGGPAQTGAAISVLRPRGKGDAALVQRIRANGISFDPGLIQ